MKEPQPTNIPTALYGGFISEPASFQEAPAGVRHVIKLLYRPNVRANGDVGLDVSTEAFVVDLAAFDPSVFEAERFAADCDFLKRIALAHGREVRQILVELQKGTLSGAEQAEKIAKRIGATEADAVAAGGGFIVEVIVAIGLAIAASGCVGGGAKHKATSPAATTTPKPPPSQ